MQDLSISVIIPIFNGERTIERALAAVLDQSHPPSEIIIVNDKSTDGTSSTVKNFFHQTPRTVPYKIIDLPKNSGPGTARNIGAKAATGQILAFLDADDYWKPWHLATAANAFEKGQDQKLVINQKPMLEGVDSDLSFKTPTRQTAIGVINFLLVQANYCTPGLVVPRQFFLDVGGFPERRKYAEDFELFIKLRLNCSIWLRIDEPRSVVCCKHFYLSDSGLSSNHFKMYVGTLEALIRGLSSSRYFWIMPFMTVFHSIKYIRRLIKIKLKNS
jgi:glycosyltransferase involved in cell wall biosynthesis